MTGRQIAQVVGGVVVILLVLILGFYLITNIFSNPPKLGGDKKIENVKKSETSQQWKKKVEKTLKNHEERIAGLEERQEKDADAITDHQSQLDSLKNQKEKNPNKLTEEKPQKEKNKYEKGWNSRKNWDYKDFPENW